MLRLLSAAVCLAEPSTHGVDGSRVGLSGLLLRSSFWPTPLLPWRISRAVAAKSRSFLAQFRPSLLVNWTNWKSCSCMPWCVMWVVWEQDCKCLPWLGGWGTFDPGWQRRGKVVSSLRPQWSLCCISQPSFSSARDGYLPEMDIFHPNKKLQICQTSQSTLSVSLTEDFPGFL